MRSPSFSDPAGGLRSWVQGWFFRVFLFYYFPSCSPQLMIFCRKTFEKKNLFHFQFPSPRFPHGCDVGPSFRNAQVTHAGTPGGEAQEFLGQQAGRGEAGRSGAGRRCRAGISLPRPPRPLAAGGAPAAGSPGRPGVT